MNKKKGKIKVKNKKNSFSDETYQDQVKKITKITILVLVVFAVFYLITALATGQLKFGDKKKEDTKVTIQYQEILAGEIFNLSTTDYLVIMYPFADDDSSIYSTWLTNYESNEAALPYHTVDLSNALNQRYLTEDSSNLWVENAKDLKVKEPTLLRISNKKIIEVYEGKNAISEYFN